MVFHPPELLSTCYNHLYQAHHLVLFSFYDDFPIERTRKDPTKGLSADSSQFGIQSFPLFSWGKLRIKIFNIDRNVSIYCHNPGFLTIGRPDNIERKNIVVQYYRNSDLFYGCNLNADE